MTPLKGFASLFFFLTLKTVAVQASDFSLNSQVTSKKSMLSASFENSQFSLTEGKISGSSIKADFSYFFTSKTDLEIYISSALNAQGSVQSSFTGLGGYVYYTLLGDSYETLRNINLGQQSILSEKNNRISNFQVGLGLDQFLLNGAKAVYSASGLGIGSIYRFNLYGYNFKAAARYSSMSSGAIKLQGIFMGLGIVFDL